MAQYPGHADPNGAAARTRLGDGMWRFVNICGKSIATGSERLSSADMTDADEQDRGLACGRRIRLTDGSNSTGEIIEDFGDLAGTEVVIDASRTARSRRWAVALDDGRTVFVDDDALELTS
jgi:hypothetical protein